MINLSFFPSRRLAFYMLRLFLTRTFAVLLMLVLVLMTLDLLGEAGNILSVPGNGDAELWRYVGLRVPLLISRFLPFSVLLGTLIALVALNQHSEVVAMKAAGMSAHQILAPLILGSIGIAAALFAFNEMVAVNSARVVNAWSDNDYKPIPPDSGLLSNVWILNGDDLIRAGIVAGRGAQLRAERVSIYDRGNGILHRVVAADRAVPRPASGDWLLQNVRIYDASMNVVRRVPQLEGMRGVTPEQLTIAKVDPNELDYWTLKERVAELEAAGRPSDEARAGLAHKVSGALSTILMPLLAAVAAFGLARSGQVLLRATVGMALGFAYFVADNFSLAMGNAGAYPPLVAAWAPFLLFLLIGETVLIRTEEYLERAVFVTPFPPIIRFVAALRRTIEPLVRAPQPVEPAGESRIAVVDGAVLDHECAQSRLLPHIGEEVGASHRRALGCAVRSASGRIGRGARREIILIVAGALLFLRRIDPEVAVEVIVRGRRPREVPAHPPLVRLQLGEGRARNGPQHHVVIGKVDPEAVEAVGDRRA